MPPPLDTAKGLFSTKYCTYQKKIVPLWAQLSMCIRIQQQNKNIYEIYRDHTGTLCLDTLSG